MTNLSSLPTFTCNKCEFHTNDLLLFKEHFNNNHKIWITCSFCSYKTGFPSTMKIHENLHNKIKISCSDCGFKTCQQSSLARHRSRFHTKTQLFCNLCTNTFYTEPGLRKHVEKDHDYYQCPLCDFNSKTRKSLNQHIVAMHKQLKLMCPYCEFYTNYKSNLNRHILAKHTSTKICCTLCFYQTTRPVYLTNHVNKYHSDIIK